MGSPDLDAKDIQLDARPELLGTPRRAKAKQVISNQLESKLRPLSSPAGVFLFWKQRTHNMSKPTARSLTVEQIKELFVLCQSTGKVLHSPDRPRHTFQTEGAFKTFRKRWGGKPLSFTSHPDGYRVAVTTLKRRRITFYEHHLVYVLSNDKQPAPGMVIDHINHVRDDNRPENLRELTPEENMSNLTHFINVKANDEGKKKRMQYAIENLKDGNLKLELFLVGGVCFFAHVFETDREVKAAINGANLIADWAINDNTPIPPAPPIYGNEPEMCACIRGGEAMLKVFDNIYAGLEAEKAAAGA